GPRGASVALRRPAPVLRDADGKRNVLSLPGVHDGGGDRGAFHPALSVERKGRLVTAPLSVLGGLSPPDKRETRCLHWSRGPVRGKVSRGRRPQAKDPARRSRRFVPSRRGSATAQAHRCWTCCCPRAR